MTFSYQPARELQKNTKLKFVNWTSKNERIVELKIVNEQIFISFIYLWTLFHSGIKLHKIDHTFKTYD